MINLVIDIGNTLSKVALFNNRDLQSVEHIEVPLEVYLSDFLKRNKIDNSIISSVKNDIGSIETLLSSKTNHLHFTGLTPSAVVNQYKTPGTLGLDRYAAVIAAQALYPAENCLIIDSGTCITYDFIDAEKRYLGGSISPGITMRFKAMNTFTERLPLLEPDADSHSNYGNDTRSSMITGVQKGVLYEVLGFIESFYSKWPALNVILCGGDFNFFDTQLKSSIFAHTLKTEPNLVLIGLNEVIHYNND